MNQRRPHLDGSDGEGDLPPAIDVRVENTKNVLELLRDDQRLKEHNIHVRLSTLRRFRLCYTPCLLCDAMMGHFMVCLLNLAACLNSVWVHTANSFGSTQQSSRSCCSRCLHYESYSVNGSPEQLSTPPGETLLHLNLSYSLSKSTNVKIPTC